MLVLVDGCCFGLAIGSSSTASAEAAAYLTFTALGVRVFGARDFLAGDRMSTSEPFVIGVHLLRFRPPARDGRRGAFRSVHIFQPYYRFNRYVSSLTPHTMYALCVPNLRSEEE